MYSNKGYVICFPFPINLDIHLSIALKTHRIFLQPKLTGEFHELYILAQKTHLSIFTYYALRK